VVVIRNRCGETMGNFVIDKGLNIPTYSTVCTYCRHLLLMGKGRKCKAFPAGIPMDIWMGDNNHTQIHPDQENNIVFEPIGKE